LTPATLTLITSAQPVNVIDRGPSLMSMQKESIGFFFCAQNPGNKNVRVKYRVDVPGAVNLSVVSFSGRTVGCLTNAYHKAGAYSLEWNPLNKSGVYFFVLKTNSDKTIRKALMVQ
jgi:hypothetical protein